jgi:hypothetical protein
MCVCVRKTSDRWIFFSFEVNILFCRCLSTYYKCSQVSNEDLMMCGRDGKLLLKRFSIIERNRALQDKTSITLSLYVWYI